MGQKSSQIKSEANLAKRIRFFMDQQGMTRADLAEALGKSEDSIKSMLAGRGLTQYIKFAELATMLGTTPNELLGYEANATGDVMQTALRVVLEALGLDQDQAQELTSIVLKAVQEAPALAQDMPAEAVARILIQSNAKKFRQ